MRPATKTTQKHTVTFIVRMLAAECGDWRGQIEHVQSGQILRFRNGIQALRFMDRIVQDVACDTTGEPDRQSCRGPKSGGVEWCDPGN